MRYAQLLYVMRATCRGWVSLTGGQPVPSVIVEQFARDILTFLDHHTDPLHDVRTILLSQRPFTELDHCVYATVELARSHVLRRNEVVDAIAHNAILLALAESDTGTQNPLVDLLSLFPGDLLSEAREHLTTRVMMRNRPIAFRRALEMLDERASSPGNLSPGSSSDNDVPEKPKIHGS
jgi:hypothetical protein